jgi:hypothetical protein
VHPVAETHSKFFIMVVLDSKVFFSPTEVHKIDGEVATQIEDSKEYEARVHKLRVVSTYVE